MSTAVRVVAPGALMWTGSSWVISGWVFTLGGSLMTAETGTLYRREIQQAVRDYMAASLGFRDTFEAVPPAVEIEALRETQALLARFSEASKPTVFQRIRRALCL